MRSMNRTILTCGACARRRAFTVAELCIGLAVTAMVLCTLASFMLATGKAWADAGDGREQSILGWQGAQRLAQIVQQAKLIPSIQPGSLTSLLSSPAGVILWQNDTNGDGLIEFGELAVISADQAADGSWTLNLYQPSPTSPSLATIWDYSVLQNPSSINILKPLMTATPLMHGLSGVRIVQPTQTTMQKPFIEFGLAIPATASTGAQVVYISAACRAPLEAPNN